MLNERHGESDVTPTDGWKLSSGSRETPETSGFSMEADRSEKARGLKSDRHGRWRGVTQFHSTEETSEQGPGAKACGVGGGKGIDQGEHRAIATGPDTEPEIERETVGIQVARIVGCT